MMMANKNSPDAGTSGLKAWNNEQFNYTHVSKKVNTEVRMEHDFGEKTVESFKGEDLKVCQTPKYKVSRAKAIEMIESGKYGLSDGDFWILMNSAGKKMIYTGLITSHNACLKINDKMEAKFRPECVSVDKSGYGNSLVFTYMCPEQGLYEVGEASGTNCKNSYPYAMAYKRLFDRVVLKLSRLAYDGVYSEAEAEEFKRDYDRDTRGEEELDMTPAPKANKAVPEKTESKPISVSSKIGTDEKAPAPVQKALQPWRMSVLKNLAESLGTDGQGLCKTVSALQQRGEAPQGTFSGMTDEDFTKLVEAVQRMGTNKGLLA